MSSRLSALLVWGLAGAALVFWALRLFVPSMPVPGNAQVAGTGTTLVGDLTRLLGAPPVAAAEAAAVVPDAASRFRLTGVVATRTARDPDGPAAPGLALISVDGKPPQAYRVGDPVDPKWVLQSVGLRSARIGLDAGPRGFLLELPPPAPAATGVPSFNANPLTPPVYAPPGYVPAPPSMGQAPPGAPMPPTGMSVQPGQPQPVPQDARPREQIQ